ncbi:hypothetical protein PS627_01548 [Pseudomonas fluorescens]|nr:hypothetical protein PS627_01548 [Pseudomonas fluorescens]VVP86833.1 hypothetical protein PS910_02489 [Pseudomonas fluorescens]
MDLQRAQTVHLIEWAGKFTARPFDLYRVKAQCVSFFWPAWPEASK